MRTITIRLSKDEERWVEETLARMSTVELLNYFETRVELTQDRDAWKDFAQDLARKREIVKSLLLDRIEKAELKFDSPYSEVAKFQIEVDSNSTGTATCQHESDCGYPHAEVITPMIPRCKKCGMELPA